ncbi:alpha/beta hydrolase, partial [Lactobacillus sp.]|uniref:alpha/beta hydrolase n=1 Tax=Lactobacillus sp. TaxID=1591 RepID=UPI003F077C30
MTKEELAEAVIKLRSEFKASDDKRDEGLPTEIPEVERINDISYGPDPKWNLLDIYLPKDRTGKVPVIISIHGGGWVYGTKETYQFYGMGLAKEGFAFVNFNYRLAPDVQFPSELDDVNRVMHWVAEHGAEY